MFNFSFVWQSNVALHRSITIFCWERCDQSPCPKEQNKKTKNKNKLENTLSKPNSITAQECGAVESNWRQNLIFRRLFFLHYTTLFTTCCNACYSFHSELISTGQQKRRAQENSKQRTQHGQQQQRGPVSHLRCVWKKKDVIFLGVTLLGTCILNHHPASRMMEITKVSWLENQDS